MHTIGFRKKVYENEHRQYFEISFFSSYETSVFNYRGVEVNIFPFTCKCSYDIEHNVLVMPRSI